MDAETYLRILCAMNIFARRDGSSWYYGLGPDAAIVVIPR